GRETPPEKGQAGFFRLCFSERGVMVNRSGPNGRDNSRAQMECCLSEPRAEGLLVSAGPVGVVRPFWAQDSPTGPGPWQKLEIEVALNGIEGFWVPGDGERQSLGKLSSLQIEQHLEAIKAVNPPYATVPAIFRPRSSLGLLILKSKVSFRRVILEP